MEYVIIGLLLLILLFFSTLSDKATQVIRVLEKLKTAQEIEQNTWAEERKDYQAQIRAQEEELKAILRETGKYYNIVERE